jgi:hypothetical protein
MSDLPAQPATKTVSIPEGPANELIQTLGNLLDETAAIVWNATHDPESFDRASANAKALDIKARAHAAIESAFETARPTAEPYAYRWQWKAGEQPSALACGCTLRTESVGSIQRCVIAMCPEHSRLNEQAWRRHENRPTDEVS